VRQTRSSSRSDAKPMMYSLYFHRKLYLERSSYHMFFLWVVRKKNSMVHNEPWIQKTTAWYF